MAENDNDNRMASELESEGGSGYVLGEGPDAVVISAAEARRLRRLGLLTTPFIVRHAVFQKKLFHYSSKPCLFNMTYLNNLKSLFHIEVLVSPN